MARLERVNPALRRRLDNAVVEAFNRPCLNGNLEMAAELLAVLNTMGLRGNKRIDGGEVLAPLCHGTRRHTIHDLQ
jgi:hypothetical protein